jgi:hypothetical protein
LSRSLHVGRDDIGKEEVEMTEGEVEMTKGGVIKNDKRWRIILMVWI